MSEADPLARGSASQVKDWRAHFREQIEKLRGFPQGTDSWRAHQPTASVFLLAQKIVNAIARNEMPLPFVAAGADGSIEVTWRRGHERELSCFIEPDAVNVVLIRDGECYESGLEQPGRINEYVSRLFD